MSLQTLPNYPRAVLILDPDYYTSSIFVEPMRNDIQKLLEDFVSSYSSSTPPRHVFIIFKDVWSGGGWEFLHLCAIDDVVRDTFLVTVFRLFIERLNEQEPVLTRAGALFGLYTAYFSQPTLQCRRQNHIPIPIDTYASLQTLFTSVPNDVSLYTTYVLSRMMNSRVFLILPHSSTSPYSPCKLPRAILQEVDPLKRKKIGRRSKRDKGLIALGNLHTLEALVAAGSEPVNAEEDEEEMYLKAKEELLATVPSELVQKAERETLVRLREINSSVGEEEVVEREGIKRVETSIEGGQGLLHLLRRERGLVNRRP